MSTNPPTAPTYRQALEKEAAYQVARLSDLPVHDARVPCAHLSITTPDGNGAYCFRCGEPLA